MNPNNRVGSYQGQRESLRNKFLCLHTLVHKHMEFQWKASTNRLMTTLMKGCPMEETTIAKKIFQLVPKLSNYMKETSMATTLAPHERLLSLFLKFAKEVKDEEFLTKPQITCLSEFGLFYTTSLENVPNGLRNCLYH